MTPRCAVDEVQGVLAHSAGAAKLAMRVKAVPDKGKANKAVIALFATWADCPKSDIEIIRGATARIKTLRVTGSAVQLSRVQAKLETLTHER